MYITLDLASAVKVIKTFRSHVEPEMLIAYDLTSIKFINIFTVCNDSEIKIHMDEFLKFWNTPKFLK